MAGTSAPCGREAARASFPLVLAVILPLASGACSLGGGGGITPIRTAFNRGVHHFSHGRLDEAVAEYRLALEEDPRDYRARFNLAVALEAMAHEADEAGEAARLRRLAEEHYRRILAERPGDIRAAVNLAAMEHERGERDASRRRLLEAAERHPRQALPHIALAARLLEDAREALAAENATQAELHAGEALERLDEAVVRNPASTEAHMLLGDAHALLAALPPEARETGRGERPGKHLARAREAYDRALAREPSDPATLIARGRLEVVAGRLADAATWLRRALYVDPDHVLAHWELSRVLERLGELEEATAHAWDARRLDGRGEIEPAVYRQRLLELYRRLEEGERRKETLAGERR